MPPFDPEAAARTLGGLLGLSEGLDGPAGFLILSDAYSRLEEVLPDINAQYQLNPRKHDKYQAELMALFLPSLFRKLANHPLSAFAAVDECLPSTYVSIFTKMVHSTVGFRFVREHPEEISRLGPRLLQMILTVSAQFEDDPLDGMYLLLLTDLLKSYNTLWILDRLSRDEATPSVPDALQIPLPVRLQFRQRFARMETFDTLCPGPQDGKIAYKGALESFRAGIFPEEYKTRRGAEFIDRDIAGVKDSPYWVCEAQNSRHGVKGPDSQCDAVPRSELRACARCRAIRYCSERHQTLHWKQHKRFCVEPTW